MEISTQIKVEEMKKSLRPKLIRLKKAELIRIIFKVWDELDENFVVESKKYLKEILFLTGLLTFLSLLYTVEVFIRSGWILKTLWSVTSIFWIVSFIGRYKIYRSLK